MLCPAVSNPLRRRTPCIQLGTALWHLQLLACQQQHQQQHSVADALLPPAAAYLRQTFRSSTRSNWSSPSDTAAAAAAADRQPHAAHSSLSREPETPLLHAIRNRIMIRGGPLSVAEYMQEVLTNPTSGYYMKQDVFGSKGDFTTSPEISQMFGEMLGIWCVVIWQQLGCPSSLQLVELGPGRGTLMADLLRGTAAFKPFSDALQVHLVEVSPFLRREQWKKLQCSSSSSSTASGSSASRSCAGGSIESSSSSSVEGSRKAAGKDSAVLDTAVSGLNGSQVSWHSSLDAVPAAAGPSIYIAHEFLDALPVHQFVRDPRRGWLEIMVDSEEAVDTTAGAAAAADNATSSDQDGRRTYEGVPLVTPPKPRPQQQHPIVQQQQHDSQQQALSEQGLHLRFVLSPSPTPAAQLLVKRRLEAMVDSKGDDDDGEAGTQETPQQASQQQQAEPRQPTAIEIGAQAMAVVESLARRISASGGAALLIDYGANKPYTNSLTGIRNHRGVHPLSQPGTADLSAWVDFSAMRMAAEQAFDIQPAAGAGAGAGVGAGAAGSSSRDKGTPAAAAGPGMHAASSSSSNSSSSSGVDVFGPISQEHLLHSLGIQARLQSLAEAEELLAGYKRLVDTEPGGMGANYLALAITHKGLGVPVGFEQEAGGGGGGGSTP